MTQTKHNKPRLTGADLLETVEEVDELLGVPVTRLFAQPEVYFPEDVFVNFVPSNGTEH